MSSCQCFYYQHSTFKTFMNNDSPVTDGNIEYTDFISWTLNIHSPCYESLYIAIYTKIENAEDVYEGVE